MEYFVVAMPMYGAREGQMNRLECPSFETAKIVAVDMTKSGQFLFVEVEDGEGNTSVSEAAITEMRRKG
jgi:hypothetical protein